MRIGISLLVAFAPLGLLAFEAAVPVHKWAADMKWFDAQDVKKTCPPGGVVFVGSSSIRMWNLPKSFPELKPLNRGFGGSHLADSVAEVDRLVIRHRPRTVVVYAGDNDIAAGKSAEQVVKDLEAFVAEVHEALPETKIVYIGIKPSLARWKLAEEMKEANAGLKAVCERHENCEFVDVWGPMLDDEGMPKKEFFVWDGLHMTPEGYEVWAGLVGPHLE